MNICLIITGSIAAYKSAELVRELVKLGHSVQAIMTQGAQKFITPLTLQTLTNKAVATDLWSLEEEHSIGHIRIADEADLVVVAPASANFIAGIAGGFALDIAQTVFLAATCPVLVCPAMNVNMLNNSVTKENVEKLKSRGIRVLEPATGELACGWVGQGRLPDITDIIAEIERIIPQPLKGKSVVVTAGPTREKIDPMRVITNLSSGKTGFEIASQAQRLGAEVKFLAGPGVSVPDGVDVSYFESAEDLNKLLNQVILDLKEVKDITLIMTAAPADFRPENVSDAKLPKNSDKHSSIKLTLNPDIIKAIAERRSEFGNLTNIVAFSATDEDGLFEKATKKLNEKKVDFVVANVISTSVNQELTELFLIDRQGLRGSSNRVPKRAAAKWLLQEIFGI